MPSKQKCVRVERGLYRMGNYYHVCATPPGSRTVIWRALGKVRLMQARRLRDKFAAEVQGAQLPASRTRATFGELAAEWLAEQNARLEVGELSPHPRGLRAGSALPRAAGVRFAAGARNHC